VQGLDAGFRPKSSAQSGAGLVRWRRVIGAPIWGIPVFLMKLLTIELIDKPRLPYLHALACAHAIRSNTGCRAQCGAGDTRRTPAGPRFRSRRTVARCERPFAGWAHRALRRFAGTERRW
jgi:hypothetical protein